MRKTVTSRNLHGGYDYRYSIVCDLCHKPLQRTVKKESYTAEFLTCGEETLSALAVGWIVEGTTAICNNCLDSIGK